MVTSAQPAAADHLLFNSSMTISDVTRCEGYSGGPALDFGFAGFVVKLDHHASGKTITVKYATSGVTATGGVDYTSKTGTLTFGPNEVSKPVLVSLKDDPAGESNETFNVKLSAVTGPAGLSDSVGRGTILDDDPGKLHALDAVGPEDSTPLTVKVRRCGDYGSKASVKYATANSTAVAPGDYVSKTGTLQFAANDTVKPIPVAIQNDSVEEPDEKFRVVLSAPTGATFGDSLGIGTILANDQPGPS